MSPYVPETVTDNAIISLLTSLDYNLDCLEESLTKLELTAAVFLKAQASADSCGEDGVKASSSRSPTVTHLQALIQKTMDLQASIETLTQRVDV